MIVTSTHIFVNDVNGNQAVFANTGQVARDAAREVWEDDVYRLNTLDLVGHCVVDVGAHQGVFTARVLALGASTVWAVEPSPANMAVLRDNLVLNGVDLERVVCLEAAVGAAAGRGAASLVDGGDMVTVAADGDGDVEVVSFGQLLFDAASVRGGTVRLLKVDIEGAEFEAVTGCPDLGYAQRVVMETHASSDGELGRLVERLLDTHNLDVFGHPSRGGMLYGDRY